ncbi:MAG: CehA/McbA family metallohydrolase [Oceanococcaceae bacterium]
MTKFHRLTLITVCLSASGLLACDGGRPAGQRDDSPPPPAPPTPIAATAPQGLWLASDVHVHTDHSSDGSAFRQLSDDALPGNVSVADQILQSTLQGLDFLPLTDHRTYDQHWDPLWTSGAVLLIPGEESNGRPHANVFGGVDTILNGPADEERGFRATQQGVWDAHGQAAVFQTNHANRDWTEDGVVPNVHANTLGIDVIEAWNIGENITQQLQYAENRWNAGFLAGITASSDNHFRELWLLGFGPGAVQTEVFAAARTERAILNALRRGRTTLTDGTPLGARVELHADADGDGVFEGVVGDALTAMPGQPVTVQVRTERALGLDVLVYARPGLAAGPIQRFQVTQLAQNFTFDIPMPDTHHWVRAEIRGPGVPRVGLEASLADESDRRALSSPVFLLPHGAIPQPQTDIAVPADRGTTDAAAQVFAAADQFSGFSDLAHTDAGVVSVAELHTETGTDVWFRRAGAAPLRLNATEGFARFPRVAARGAQVWVVWEDERAGQMPRRPQIWARMSVDGGRQWQPEMRIDSSTARAIRPDLALTADGTPVFAWSDNTRRCFDVFVRIGIDGPSDNLTADKACTPGTPLDTRSPRDPASLLPALAVAPGDIIHVVWQDNRFDINPGWTGQTGFVGGFAGLDRTDPDNWEILGRRFDPRDGSWQPATRISNNGNPEDPDDESALADRHPTVAVSADNRVLVAWDSKPLRAAGVNSAIVMAHSADSGQNWSTPALVATDPEAMSQRPAASAAATGGIDLVWMDSRDSDWRHRVWGTRWTGEPLTTATRLSGPGNAVWPRVDNGTLSFHSDRDTAVQRDWRWRVYQRPLTAVALQADSTVPARNTAVTAPAPLTLTTWRQLWEQRAPAGTASVLHELPHSHQHGS